MPNRRKKNRKAARRNNTINHNKQNVNNAIPLTDDEVNSLLTTGVAVVEELDF